MYKLVICVRRDLCLSAGKIAAQVAHAAVMCALEAKKKGKHFASWYNEGQKKVVVWAENLEHLKKIAKKAKNLGVNVCMVQDAGLTEVPPNTITCVGVGPGPAELIDKVTGSLPLV